MQIARSVSAVSKIVAESYKIIVTLILAYYVIREAVSMEMQKRREHVFHNHEKR